MSSVQDDEDLTRKQRRDAARAERKALEEAELARGMRRTRLTQLGLVVTIVVIAIVVIVVATSGGGSKGGLAKSEPEVNKNVTTVKSIIGGIPQNGNVLGSPSAEATLVYFGDLECPICKEFTLGALPGIISKWVRAGKLKIEYKSLETATREPEVFKTQQIAALAAGKQNLMWYFIELFYHEQGQEDTGYVTESYIQGLARQVPGLNLTTWAEDRKDPQFENTITTDAQEANTEGFNGTPSFLLGKSGTKLKKVAELSLTESSAWDSAIESALKS
jgi:protein-disulfide isomerase